jgi:hypothetical protein
MKTKSPKQQTDVEVIEYDPNDYDPAGDTAMGSWLVEAVNELKGALIAIRAVRYRISVVEANSGSSETDEPVDRMLHEITRRIAGAQRDIYVAMLDIDTN